MVKHIDITNLVDFGFSDDEYLPILKCACGAEFKPWEYMISIYSDDVNACPKCGLKLYFSVSVRVYKTIED